MVAERRSSPQPMRRGVVSVDCPETNWPVEVRFEALPEQAALVPGAALVPQPLGDGRWRIERYCSLCDEAHSFDVVEDDVTARPAGPSLPSIELQPTLDLPRSLESTIGSSRLEPRGPNAPVVSSDDVARVYARCRPSPAEAARAYHAGARLARSSDPADLARARQLLERAQELAERRDAPPGEGTPAASSG